MFLLVFPCFFRRRKQIINMPIAESKSACAEGGVESKLEENYSQ